MSEETIAFMVFAFVASVTPGPNNVLLTAAGAQVGVVRGLPGLFGIASGFGLMIFVLALGLGTAILDRPDVMMGMRYAGVAMLIWISWKIASAPVGNTQGEAEADLKSARPIGFWGGALFQWVNPKAWLVVASAIAAYMNPDSGILEQAVSFSLVFMLAGLLGCFPWLAGGAVVGRFLKTQRAARIFNIAMALLLLATIGMIVG